MNLRVFKFGGASVCSDSGVRQVADILEKQGDDHVVAVISAMGKTTNALEEVLQHFRTGDSIAMIESFESVKEFHFQLLARLFPNTGHFVYKEIGALFNQLQGILRRGHLYRTEKPLYDFDYDQIVSFGELFSTTLVYHYLKERKQSVALFDVRTLIKTDSTYRDAHVLWEPTKTLIRNAVKGYFGNSQTGGKIALTQGFLGSDASGNTTTLGREGSDFSAAIFAYSIQAKEMIIWKDVPGVMNADPKWMKNAEKIDHLSYREAIELAYYGASIIHPRTIKPLENANIVLRVKSFLDPESTGTTIENISAWTIDTPIFIRKQNQVLISLSPRDFSFIVEENLSEIFRILAEFRVKVNVMQNSAISFSICVDEDIQKLPPLLSHLKTDYETRYNEGLELYTIRHYTKEAIDRITQGKRVLMELRSRNTLQLVTK
ncbi:MAG: aspartate kinase [Bacteroidales bacterium]|nr:aspartate kinase [Bacteroidales bacterium]